MFKRGLNPSRPSKYDLDLAVRTVSWSVELSAQIRYACYKVVERNVVVGKREKFTLWT